MNWHNTLNEAIGTHTVNWPLGVNINYNQTVQIVENGLFMSVSRDNRGLYETAITYKSLCQNFVKTLSF